MSPRYSPVDATRRLSESRLHHAVIVLRAVFRLARSRRLVTRSPIDELDPSELPKRRSGTTRPRLDEQELVAIVRHATEPYRIGVALLAPPVAGKPPISSARCMTGHSLDVWVRHYVGRGGPSQRTDARAPPFDGGLGVIVDERDDA